jgi:hypothetical protein
MQAAWREHCSKLTIAQLMDRAQTEEHIRQFECELVSQGLQGTALEDCDDVQELIARELGSCLDVDPAAPRADALRVLAGASQAFKIARMTEEVANKAKAAAVEGEFIMQVKLRTLAAYGSWVMDEVEMAMKVVRSLRLLGYQSGTSQTWDEQKLQWEPVICLAWI